MVETNITKRWESGTPHHPKSIELFRSLAEIDWEFGGDYFRWKSGGDGDNGEHLMYEMDIYFETLESRNQGGVRQIQDRSPLLDFADSLSDIPPEFAKTLNESFHELF